MGYKESCKIVEYSMHVLLNTELHRLADVRLNQEWKGHATSMYSTCLRSSIVAQYFVKKKLVGTLLETNSYIQSATENQWFFGWFRWTFPFGALNGLFSMAI